jgi:hypothetical protein
VPIPDCVKDLREVLDVGRVEEWIETVLDEVPIRPNQDEQHRWQGDTAQGNQN